MLCACSGERFQFEEAPQSPESLATRDFSVSGISSKTGEWETRCDDSQVENVETTLKETLSLNYEEARALLGRLEYQRGNCEAALQVFQGIDVRSLKPRMTKAIIERSRQRKCRPKGEILLVNVMSLHSVSLILEAILLKSMSLEGLRRFKEAAMECKDILDTVESAWPKGMPENFGEDCKLQGVFHNALELLPKLWKQAGFFEEAISAYRRALVKPWNLDPQRLAGIEKDLAAILLYGGVEATKLSELQQLWGSTIPRSNMEEAMLLLFVLMRKVAIQDICWDPEIMDHLTFALSVSGLFEVLAGLFEQTLPGIYNRIERWYILALCYCAAGEDETALDLLRKSVGHSERKQKPHLPSLLFGARLCSQNQNHAYEGTDFAKKAVQLVHCRAVHLVSMAYRLLGLCYGYCARSFRSDSERLSLQNESLRALHHAAITGSDDPEVMFALGMENAVQRNMTSALENVTKYMELVAGSSVRGWHLLALVLSAKKNFKDAEAIVDLALEETGIGDQLGLLRLKALLQISQEQPKHAIETYSILLAMFQANKEIKSTKSNPQLTMRKNLEAGAWVDLASIYAKLGSWRDSEICLEKAESVQCFSPKNWHAKGMLLEAQSSYREALVAFIFSLSIEPDYVPSMVSTAAVLRKLGGKSLPIARSFLMNALRLEPMNDDAWFNLGLVSKMEGSLQQAADCFKAACELSETSPVLAIP